MTTLIHRAMPHKLHMRGIEAMTLVSNTHFPRHSHDQYGIGIIDVGAHRSWSAIGNVTASAGDVIMVNPGEIHDGEPLTGEVRHWRMIYFDPEVLTRQAEGEFAGEFHIVRPVARDAVLATFVSRLFASLTAGHMDGLVIEERLLHIAMRALKCHSIARPILGSPSASVARAVERLRAAIDEQVSLSELAALSGVSRFQLLRNFVRQMGITPHAYLLQHRLQVARKLLAAGQTPIQAAIEAGFADQSHLTRIFVRYLGITPARYRAATA